MDVRHYFDAVIFLKFSETNPSGWKYSLGEAIEKHTKRLKVEKIQKLDLVIFGVPFDSRTPGKETTEAPDIIRNDLYYLAKPEQDLKIADFGNLKPSVNSKGIYKALRDIVEYFNEINVPVIIIGGSQDLNYGICEAFNTNKLFTYSTIDATLDIKKGREQFSSKNYLTKIFSGNPQIFQFSLIGYQGHKIAKEYFLKTRGINNHVRLGQLRDDITVAEPILRNSDVLSFDIGAIKYSDAPSRNCMNPNGLRSEEACQLAKYAGMSERLKVFGLYDTDPEKDENNITIKLSAQIIWYFIDGFTNRKNLKTSLDENRVVYQVDVKGVSNPLVFYKNNITGQWWMELQSFKNEKIVIGCTEEEYIQASNNDIPQMWLKYIQKIDEILK